MKNKFATALAALLLLWGFSQAQTFTPVSLISPTLVTPISGALQPGALYKYSNAAGAPGNYIDAYVQIVKKSNTGSDAVGLFAFDQPASVNNPGGYDSAFQPVTNCSGTNSSGLWTQGGQCGTGYVQLSQSASQNYLVHFRLYFKKAGTLIDTALNIRAAFIDIDGFGGGTEAEQNAFMPPSYYAVAPGTTLTITQRSDGLYNAEGQPANVGGIQMTATTAITQVTYLNRTFIDFGIGMNTHNANANGACYSAVAGGRLASVSFAGQPVGCTVLTPDTISLSGTVWDDADGSANGTFSNIKTGSEVGTPGGGLYVYALDSASGTVLGKSVVASNGTWSITGITKDLPIQLVLSTANVAVGVTNGAPAGSVNSGWVGTSPLTRPSFRPSANTINLDFGIEQIPVGANYTAASQLNPGGTSTVPVPTAAFTGVDAEDGTYTTGLSGKKVTLTPGANGNLYYNGVLITTSTTYTNFNPSLVSIDPTGPTPTAQSSVTSTFTYNVYDAANQPSVAKTISLPFEPPILISGNVWDDANGDAIKAGTEAFTNAGGLNAVLTDASGTVIQVVAVAPSTGAYQFNQSISNTTYKVVLTTSTPTVGSSLTTSSLPSPAAGAWVNTGVNLNGVANTANKTGIITVTTASAAVTNQNFGIEEIPVGANYTAASQLNPGGTSTVPVPTAAFTGVDAEDGTYTAGLGGKTVTLIPGANENLYYNGTLVTTATTYNNFNPSLVAVDPTGPNPTAFVAVTSTLIYSVFDAAGQPSAAKTITLPFDAALCINLRVYLQGALINNGNAIAPIGGQPLMRDDLRNSPFTATNYIPTQDPYEFATPYINITSKYTKLPPQDASHPQFQQVTSSSVFSAIGQNAIVDWVFVELRNKANNAQVLATRAGLLQRDGDVVDVDGVSCLQFPGVAIDSYYVAIRHRSHLGTMTKYAQSATNLQSLVDFTVTTTPLYDNGIVSGFNFSGLSQKANVAGNYRAMWQGDFNADGKVKYDNPNDDLSVMLFEATRYPTNTTRATNYDFAYGYRQGDFDMNSKVKYDNPNDDNAMLLFQLSRYPLNNTRATNFDFFLQQLP